MNSAEAEYKSKYSEPATTETTTEKVAEQTATTAKADVSDAFDELFNS